MSEFNSFLNWIIESFRLIYNFMITQHPIVQAVFFMPIGLLVITLFINVVKSIIQGGS